jgi:hypothetical protein
MMDGFKTEAGIEVPAVNVSQMQGVERIAVEEMGLTLFPGKHTILSLSL